MNENDNEKKKRKVKGMIRLAYATIIFVIIMYVLMITCVIPSGRFASICDDNFGTLIFIV